MATQHGGRQADHKHHGGNQPGEDDPHGQPDTPPTVDDKEPIRQDTHRGQRPVPERERNQSDKE